MRITFDRSVELVNVTGLYGNGDTAQIFKKGVILSSLAFGGLIIVAALLKGLFMFYMRQTIIVVSRLIEYDMKNDIYGQYQNMSVSFYRKYFTGDLMARISEDVSRVRMYVGPAIMYFVNLVFTFVSVVYMMINVNPKLSLYVLLPLPILSISIYYISDIINKKSDAIQTKLSAITSFVQETFSGIRVIKSFAVENKFALDFEKENEQYRKESMGLAKINALFMPMMMMLIGLSTLFTIYFGGMEVINGTFTFGNIAEFVIYVNLLTWPVASLGWVTSIVQRAAASQERINEFMNTKPDVVSPSSESFEYNSTLSFKNISYSYPGKAVPALQNISFDLPKGYVLGIVGTTGSGKTTLAGLLLRLFDPSEGEVLVDEKSLKSINLGLYRDKIGYVPQDVFLFSETIKDNIAFGKKGKVPSMKEIELAAQKASVYSNIMDFPNRFDTMLGERGITLSGGQKQRVAIARALIRNPEILILDDCLSAVDHHTEKEIISSLNKEMADKTAVIISHRVSSVIQANNILVLHEGKIVEQGDHKTLMSRNGVYAQLYEKQMELTE